MFTAAVSDIYWPGHAGEIALAFFHVETNWLASFLLVHSLWKKLVVINLLIESSQVYAGNWILYLYERCLCCRGMASCVELLIFPALSGSQQICSHETRINRPMKCKSTWSHLNTVDREFDGGINPRGKFYSRLPRQNSNIELHYLLAGGLCVSRRKCKLHTWDWVFISTF